MKYDHMVKVNGEYYPSGVDVPDANKEKAVEETLPPYSDKEIAFETQHDTDAEEAKQYSKTDINTMKTADLQSLATSVGIDGAEEMTGAELKKLLIEHYGL